MIDQDLLTAIQFHLVETPDGGASWSSGLWTRDEILANLNQRQSKLLKNTLILVIATSSQLPVPADWTVPANTNTATLPADLLRLVGVVWYDSTKPPNPLPLVPGVQRTLMRTDSFELDHLIPTWDSVGQPYPLVYTEYEWNTLQIRLGPTPAVDGFVSFLYVPRTLHPIPPPPPAPQPPADQIPYPELTGDGMPLAVPDEFAHAIKYGVLADALAKDGRGKDPARAAYCEQRFDLAVELANLILEGWA